MRKLKNEELNRISVDEFKLADKIPIILILDNIRSLNNLGSIFRTADAFKLEGIFLCGITATPPHREIHKTALGSTESVSWKYFKNTEDAINLVKNDDYSIYAIEQTEDSIFLNDFTPMKNKPLAFVFGHEVKGVQQKIINLSDGCLEIPQFGTKHSLNVAVSAGIVLWDIYNKML